MRFTIWQGSSEGVLARIIHRTLLQDRGLAIVDVEGSINEWVMLLCCEDEKGGVLEGGLNGDINFIARDL